MAASFKNTVLLTIQDAPLFTFYFDIIADVLPVEDGCLFLNHVKRFSVATLCCPEPITRRKSFKIGFGILKGGRDVTSSKYKDFSFGFLCCDVFGCEKISREKAKNESNQNSEVSWEC
jgi:hypothetical protein